MGVSKNRGIPKSSILIGFSLIFTIHFGGKIPLFLVQHPYLELQTPHQVVFGCLGIPLNIHHHLHLCKLAQTSPERGLANAPPLEPSSRSRLGKNAKVGDGRGWQTRGEVSLMSCLKKLGSRSRVVINQNG